MENKPQAELEERQIQELESLKKAYIAVFSGKQGEMVLQDLEDKCFVNRAAFPADANAYKLARNEGMRLTVVHINNMRNLDINRLKELVKRGA